MVETEANWGSLRTYERSRGPSLFGLLASRAGTIDFLSCLGCSSQPSTKYYSPHRTLFHFIIVPIAQHPGQSVLLGRLPLCLWSKHIWCLCKETTTTEKLLDPDTKASVKSGFLNNTPTIFENISFNFFYKYILISKRERDTAKRQLHFGYGFYFYGRGILPEGI